MHVALLFPAATDPRSPHLSLPSLAASLRSDGVRVTVRDLDVEGLYWVLSRERLLDAAHVVRQKAVPTDGLGRLERNRILTYSDWIVSNTAAAFAALRTESHFLDPDRHHQARRTIDAGLALVSAASQRVQYTIRGADYSVLGVDRDCLGDLVAVTSNPADNLFEDLYADAVKDLLDDRPDLVGISILNRQQIIPGLTLARRCREMGLTVVLGGTVYAKFHEQLGARPLFFDTFCDGVVPYEGETAMRALVEAIDLGRNPHQWATVPNLLSVNSTGDVVSGPTHAEDVRNLPTPDFDGLPLHAYLNPVPVLPILTGKGCYFNRCKFCDIPYINRITKPYRVRDPQQIALDIATLHKRYGARHFEITDETLSPRLLTRIADALDDHPDIRPRFVGYARFEPGFTPGTCNRIYEMGVRKLFFGLESGNQEMLNRMDKGIKVEVAHRVLRNCADAGIGVHIFSIVGFPEEVEVQARDTLRFFADATEILRHPRNSFDIHPFGLDLRTEYGDNPKQFGIEIPDDEQLNVDFPISIHNWRNKNGMSSAEAALLISEFSETLHQQFHGERSYPDAQWPGYEEYAVVYGDFYDNVRFSWRLALPIDGDPLTFTLSWSDDARFENFPEGVVVHTLDASTSISSAALRLLNECRPPATVEQHLETLVGGLAGSDKADLRAQQRRDVRSVINQLLELRALWLRPIQNGVEHMI